MSRARLRDRRGVALALVLWVIVILGAVGLGIVGAARSQLDVARTLRASAVARYAAESGVEEARARYRELLAAADGGGGEAGAFQRLAEELEGGGDRELGDARYRVTVLDLGARVDLNASSDEVLLALFSELVGERRAASLVDALRDWTDDDDEPLPRGAEAADYARAGSPWRPPNRPLRRLDDLPRIRGFDDSVLAALAPFVTVWGDGRVNVNSAPREVLAAVPSIGPDGAEALIGARAGGGPIGSKVDLMGRLRAGLDRPVGAQLGPVTTTADRILVVSRGWEEGSPLTYEIHAVLEVVRTGALAGPDAGPSLVLRHWEERTL